MHFLNVISKKIKVSSKDVIMEEIPMKEKYETKIKVFKPQNLTCSSTKVSTACLKNVRGRIRYKYHTLTMF